MPGRPKKNPDGLLKGCYNGCMHNKQSEALSDLSADVLADVIEEHGRAFPEDAFSDGQTDELLSHVEGGEPLFDLCRVIAERKWTDEPFSDGQIHTLATYLKAGFPNLKRKSWLLLAGCSPRKKGGQ